MKCDLCDGEYQEELVTRSYAIGEKTVVVQGVPALICNRCGDILIRDETATVIDDLLANSPEPEEYAPVYRFPAKVR